MLFASNEELKSFWLDEIVDMRFSFFWCWLTVFCMYTSESEGNHDKKAKKKGFFARRREKREQKKKEKLSAAQIEVFAVFIHL